jgi:hypothetical protein
MLFYYNNISLNNIILLILKNGFYFSVAEMFLLMMTNNIFLSSMIITKLYSLNYFYWFGSYYNFFPAYPQLNWIKQFIRFTDTGHIASFLVYFYPNMLPLAHNVHFLIMMGYWSGKLFFNIGDADKIPIPDNQLIEWHVDLLTYIHHTVPYAMIVYKLAYSEMCYSFDLLSLAQVFLWGWTWFFTIYLPWRIFIGDPVYSILDDATPLKTKIGFISILHVGMLLANFVGYCICRYLF